MNQKSFDELVRNAQKRNQHIHELELQLKAERGEILQYMLDNNIIKYTVDEYLVEITRRWEYEWSDQLKQELKELDREKRRLNNEMELEKLDGITRTVKSQSIRLTTAKSLAIA